MAALVRAIWTEQFGNVIRLRPGPHTLSEVSLEVLSSVARIDWDGDDPIPDDAGKAFAFLADQPSTNYSKPFQEAWLSRIFVTSSQLEHVRVSESAPTLKRSRLDAIGREIERALEDLGSDSSATRIMTKLKSYSGEVGCAVIDTFPDGVIWRRDGSRNEEKLTTKLLRDRLGRRAKSALTR